MEHFLDCFQSTSVFSVVTNIIHSLTTPESYFQTKIYPDFFQYFVNTNNVIS